MLRTALISSYQNTTGRRIISAGTKERHSPAEIPGVVPVEIDKIMLERYFRHGIINMEIPADNYNQTSFIIDTAPLLQVGEVKQVWLTQSPKILTVHISQGKQAPKENALEVDIDKKLEGLYLTLTSRGRTTSASVYKAQTIPLYKKPVI